MIDLDSFRWLQRRAFLTRSACGLGSVALAQLLSNESARAVSTNSAGNSLLRKPPLFEPRAKNVIFLFMAGAPSQYDLFLPKPVMQKLHGQPVPASFLEGLSDSLTKGRARVRPSPRRSTQHV